MMREEIGRLYATTFDEQLYEFIVHNDNTMDCPILGINFIRKIIIKPRFVLILNESYISPPKPNTIDGLIRNFDIEDDLFKYLKEQNMIRYSTDMAYLYDFNDKEGYDFEYYEGRPFKWAEKKGPILVRQKNGKYN